MVDDIVKTLRERADLPGMWAVRPNFIEAADEIERLRARVDLLSGYLRGALNVIEGFVACDTSDARALLAGEASDDAAT
jgi:hypothetical protein